MCCLAPVIALYIVVLPAFGLPARAIVKFLERVAPLGDPVEMKVKGYHLSLRKDEASKIEVEMI